MREIAARSQRDACGDLGSEDMIIDGKDANRHGGSARNDFSL